MNQLNNSVFCFKQGACDNEILKSLPEEILEKSSIELVHGKTGDYYRKKKSTNPRSVAELHDQEEQRHSCSEQGRFSKKDKQHFEREDRQ